MIRFYSPLILCLFIPLIQLTYSEENPLIFNPYTLEIYDIGDSSTTYNNGPYAAACPASDQYGDEFFKQYSLDHKSLLVRHYSSEKDDDIFQIQCDTHVELTTVYYTDPKTKRKYFKFGYVVYYAASEYTKNFNKDLSYSDFERISTPAPAMKRIGQLFFGSSVKTPLPGKNEDPKSPEMRFMWISKATSQFNNSSWLANNISYSIHKKVDRPETECHDYKLLDKLHEKFPMDKYYSQLNQREIFQSINLRDEKCSEECVAKYSLVPAYQFQSGDSEVVSCTNFTTVPIWFTTVPMLNYLDKFLFALAQVVEKNLEIHTEPFKTLILPTYRMTDELGPTERGMYLHPNILCINDKLVIPKFILKMVVYRTHNCDTSAVLCSFQVVIVVYNGPKNKNNGRLCREDICEQLGWESIQYQDKGNPGEKSRHIYCCKLDEHLKKVLMRSAKNQIISKDLSLKNFPRYNEETQNYEYENKQEQVEDRMKQLFADDESYDPQKFWFPLPFQKKTNTNIYNY